METRIKVVIAEDYEMILRGLESLLTVKGYTVAGTAKNGQELLRVVEELRPGVVLCDIQMPVMNGIEATRELQKRFPETGVIGLTQLDEEALIVAMLKAGARGFLFKDNGMEELYDAVEAVYGGHHYYCNKSSHPLIKLIVAGGADPFPEVEKPSFNETELAIIRFVCRELVSKEIADEMGLTFYTVRKYRQQIMDKLKVRSTAGIVTYAMKEGIYVAD